MNAWPSARNLATILLLACCVVCNGQAAPLTVDQAVQIGLARDPQAVASQAAADAALANYRSLAALPPVTLGATHVQGTSTAPTLNGTNNDTFLDFGETIDTSGQRRYQAAAARVQFNAARFQYQETRLSLEQQIRDAYWTLAAAQAQTRIAEESLADSQKVYDLTVKQQEAGASPRGDVIRSSIDLANAKQALLTAQSAERTALFTFNTLLAREPSSATVLASGLNESSESIPTVNVPDLQSLQAQALSNRPLVLAASAQSSAARFAVKQAQAARLPDVSVDYQKSVEQNVNSLLFGASFPLLDFGSVKQSIRAAEKAEVQAKAQELQTRQQVEEQVAQSHSDLATAVDSASSYKTEILDPSVALLSMAQLGYQQGATGILPVIDAETTLRTARVGFINAVLAIYKAQDEMLAATGTLPPSTTP